MATSYTVYSGASVAASVDATAIATDGVGSAEIAANAIVSADVDTGLIQVATTNLTNANIKALRATPITLVAAPAAGSYIQLISASLFLNAGTNVLSETDDNLEIRWGAAGTAAATIECTGFIDQAADTMIHAYPAAAAALAKTVVDAKALVLQNNGNGEFADNAANDATMRVTVAYRVLAAGW